MSKIQKQLKSKINEVETPFDPITSLSAVKDEFGIGIDALYKEHTKYSSAYRLIVSNTDTTTVGDDVIKSTAIPNRVGANAILTVQNPFGTYPTHAVVELSYDMTNWFITTPWYMDDNAQYGIVCSANAKGNIVVQSGKQGVNGGAGSILSVPSTPAAEQTTAYLRIHCWCIRSVPSQSEIYTSRLIANVGDIRTVHDTVPPTGWHDSDGVLETDALSKYPKLIDHLIDNPWKLKTETQWQTLYEETSYSVPYYVYDELADTLRFPSIFFGIDNFKFCVCLETVYSRPSKPDLGYIKPFVFENKGSGYFIMDGRLLTEVSVKLPDFVNKWLNNDANAKYLVTEAVYQTMWVASSGTGGVARFVWDKVADTLRLPDVRGDHFVMSNSISELANWKGDALAFDSSKVTQVDTINHPREIETLWCIYLGTDHVNDNPADASSSGGGITIISEGDIASTVTLVHNTTTVVPVVSSDTGWITNKYTVKSTQLVLVSATCGITRVEDIPGNSVFIIKKNNTIVYRKSNYLLMDTNYLEVNTYLNCAKNDVLEFSILTQVELGVINSSVATDKSTKLTEFHINLVGNA